MNKRIFLDHNSTTPVHPEVVEAMLPYFSEKYGNPSSVHSFGRETKVAPEEAREKLAKFLNASPSEICFTGCGSESDNLAVKGIAWANQDKGKHIITSKIEHPAVIESCQWLEKQGFEVTYLPVDKYGLINPDDLRKAIRKDTILVSIMQANNEIGTIQPIRELSKIAHESGVYFHTDAVQSAGKILVDVKELDVDLLSLSGHKLYAPKGVGVLYIKQGTKIDIWLHGGSQERGRRSGTENVAYIVGFGKACEIAQRDLAMLSEKMTNFSTVFWEKIKAAIPDVLLNGHPMERIPNTLNLAFPGCDAQSLIMALDLQGVAVASGAACHSGAVNPSSVLAALGLPTEVALSSVRISFGRENSMEDVEYVTGILPGMVEKMRGAKKSTSAVKS
jgi:cysteine desulfurase